MTEKLKQDLKKQMIFIPKESQEVISAFGWEKISEEIGKKYFLTDDDINMLQADIGCVLVGLEGQNELAFNIEDDVGTSKNSAEKIANEVVEKIFKPIYETLSENIKNNLKNRNIHWQQNLDFILSGGDYTAFIRRVEKENEGQDSLKNNFNPSKLDDLKSKFTI